MKLTLKKKEDKNKSRVNKRHLFKALKITSVGVKTIGIVQSEFEGLWRSIDLIRGSAREKNIALERLREACFWMCRAVANQNEEEDPEAIKDTDLE